MTFEQGTLYLHLHWALKVVWPACRGPVPGVLWVPNRIRERDGLGGCGLGERSGLGGTSWRPGSGQSPAESGGPAGRQRRPAPAGLCAAPSRVCVPAWVSALRGVGEQTRGQLWGGQPHRQHPFS